MSKSRMDHFNIYCLKLLQHLHTEFPIPTKLSDEQLMLDFVDEDALAVNEIIVHHQMLGHILDFLKREGFLEFSEKSLDGHFYNARLTMRGLAVLGAVPESLTPAPERRSFIKRINSLFEKGVEAGTAKTAEEIVGGIFSLAIKSAPDVARLIGQS